MNWWRFFLFKMALLLFASVGDGDTLYYQRVLFDNSMAPDSYFHSGGKAVIPSVLRLTDGKLPVETGIYLTGPNALRLEWTSTRGGAWTAEVQLQEWRTVKFTFRVSSSTSGVTARRLCNLPVCRA